MSKEVSVESFSADILSYIKEKYGVDVKPKRVKGLAYDTLSKAGLLTTEDRFRTYEHVDRMLTMIDEAFPDTFLFEDVEHFTGNMFHSFRLLQSQILGAVYKLREEYKKKGSVDKDAVIGDLVLLEQGIKRTIGNTWKYTERTQQTGLGTLTSKIKDYILREYISRLDNLSNNK